MWLTILGFIIGALYMDYRHFRYESELEKEIIKWRRGEGRFQQ